MRCGERRSVRVGVASLLCLLAVLQARSGQAQLMHFDPIPFYSAADSTSRLALVVDVDRFTDTKFDWNVNRLHLTTIMPAGDDATFFVRLPYVTFDSGSVPLASRWPWVIGEPNEESGTGSGSGTSVVQGGLPWPYETRISGFGKIEAGVTGPLSLPVVGNTDFGVALGLPTGTETLYPMSAPSIPLRFQARKPLALRPGLQLRLLAGYLVHMDSGGDEIDPSAFPSGYQLGAALAGFGTPGRRWQLAWNFRNEDSRRSQIVSLERWLPWTGDGSIGLRAGAEIQGSLDRPANWYFSVSFRLDSSRYRPSNEEEATASRGSRGPRRR